jgi:hypothetical protein
VQPGCIQVIGSTALVVHMMHAQGCSFSPAARIVMWLPAALTPSLTPSPSQVT